MTPKMSVERAFQQNTFVFKVWSFKVWNTLVFKVWTVGFKVCHTFASNLEYPRLESASVPNWQQLWEKLAAFLRSLHNKRYFQGRSVPVLH